MSSVDPYDGSPAGANGSHQKPTQPGTTDDRSGSTALVDSLGRLGLGPVAAKVYAFLLERGLCDRRTLADHLALGHCTVERAIVQLQAFAMVSEIRGSSDQVTPLEPTAGLTFLAQQQQVNRIAGEAAARNAFESYRREYGEYAPSMVEVLTEEDIQYQVAELEDSATALVKTFDTAPYGAPTLENNIELANLASGIKYQVVYARSSIADPDRYQRNISPCMLAGEEARSCPSVPVKMIIVDDRVALVSWTTAHADRHHTALLVRQCSLLPALLALFECYWLRATPFSAASQQPNPAAAGRLRPQAVEQRLIELLAAGLTDEAAARNLGVSRRTVARHIEHLMSITGSASRFQLALRAKDSGWTP